MNKYKINKDGRVVALRDFGNVKKGDVGGFVESESNLSQDDDCWVYGNAYVSGNAHVYGNAKVCDNAWVLGNAKVYDNAWVLGNARVYGNAWVLGNASVYGDAKVYDNANVSGDAKVYDNARVYGDAKVSGNANVSGNAKVYDNARVYGDATVSGNAYVSGNAHVYGDAVATKVVQFIITGKHRITLTDTHIAIGCENHTIEHWEEHIESIGKDNGYSDDEIIYTTMMIASMIGLGGTK